MNGKRQFAGHLKGDKHKRNLRRNIRLGLASLSVVQPTQLNAASPPHAPPTTDAGAPLPYNPPTAEAGAGRQTRLPTVPRAPRAQPLPVHGDPRVRGACSHLTNEDVRKYNKGARKRTDINNRHYTNHTDRYQRDAGYRADCESHDPPTPEYLYYVDGQYAW